MPILRANIEILKYSALRIGAFLVSFIGSAMVKITVKLEWSKKYDVEWNDSVGTLKSDISYGEREANKFDLYLPADNKKDNYGLVVYLHAGGFTSGDKTNDKGTLAWLCSKGYVAAGINYTLRTDENNASVISQSEEIRSAIPKVVEAAENAGYHIDKMTMAGGSAGHALAMIYTYRDGKESPVSLVLTYGAVGPSSFYKEDWSIFGLDQDTDEALEAAAGLFGVMCGEKLTTEDMKNGSYLEKMKPIAAAEWVSNNPVPTVVAYGACDRVQAFPASRRLEKALKDNNVDYKYYVLEHSGHGLQNDSDISKQWMESVEEYLDKYMPVK